MAHPAHEGAIYLIDRNDGRPAHWWIVLNEPGRDGELLLLSFTDRKNTQAEGDTWLAGWALTDQFSLKKDSVLFLRFAALKNQAWLDSLGATYYGPATAETLWRARCNLCWHDDQIQPNIFPLFNAFRPDWCPDCFQ